MRGLIEAPSQFHSQGKIFFLRNSCRWRARHFLDTSHRERLNWNIGDFYRLRMLLGLVVIDVRSNEEKRKILREENTETNFNKNEIN